MHSEEPFPGSHFHLYHSPSLNKAWLPLSVLLCWDFPFFAVSYSNVEFLLGEETFQEGLDAKESKGLLLCLCRVLFEIAAQKIDCGCSSGDDLGSNLSVRTLL